MHSAAPHPACTPRSDVAAPMTIAPTNATAPPASSVRGKPSRRRTPASSAMNTGPMFTSIAAVPASTQCSAALSNHVVGAEPQQREQDEARQVRPRRERLAAHRDDRAEDRGGDDEPPERQRAGA